MNNRSIAGLYLRRTAAQTRGFLLRGLFDTCPDEAAPNDEVFPYN